MAFVTIEGRVDFVKRGGKGYTVIESWESRGDTHSRRWAVWFKDETPMDVGVPVKLTGVLGGKVGDPWTDREGQERPGGVEWTLNNARFVQDRTAGGAQDGQGGPQTPNTGAGDPWATPTPQSGAQAGGYDDSSVPF